MVKRDELLVKTTGDHCWLAAEAAGKIGDEADVCQIIIKVSKVRKLGEQKLKPAI